jgi:hypothetical protein
MADNRWTKEVDDATRKEEDRVSWIEKNGDCESEDVSDVKKPILLLLLWFRSFIYGSCCCSI